MHRTHIQSLAAKLHSITPTKEAAMFDQSIVLTNYYATHPNPATLSPGSFKQFIADNNPNWIHHFKNKMMLLGFMPMHWDDEDWQPAMWSNDNAMHSKNVSSCALLAVGGYLPRASVQITRHREFINTPVTSDQLSTIHPTIQTESAMLISFSQNMWRERQAGYFLIAEQEARDGLWPHSASLYVDTPYAVMLMCKYNAMQQAKQNGNMQRFEELLHYPKKRAKPIDAKAVAEKDQTRERYTQWLQHCADLKARRQIVDDKITDHREAIKVLQEELNALKAPRFK